MAVNKSNHQDTPHHGPEYKDKLRACPLRLEFVEAIIFLLHLLFYLHLLIICGRSISYFRLFSFFFSFIYFYPAL